MRLPPIELCHIKGVRRMSLTSHLRDKNSPIREFLNTRFSDTRSFLKDVRKQLRSADTIRPTVDVLGTRYPWGTIGMALDYRIRYYFDVTPHDKLIANTGARRLTLMMTPRVQRLLRASISPMEKLQELGIVLQEDGDGPLGSVYQDFFKGLDDLTRQNNPVSRRLSEAQEDELNRHCVVLGLLEEVVRIGVHPNLPLVAKEHTSVADLLEIPDTHWINDIRNLSWRFYDNFNHLLSLPYSLNPTFDGSDDIGGADAEMIVDGTLIDIKATKVQEIEPDWLWQLLGYVLLDYSDHNLINGIGLYMARQGTLFQWDLEEAIRGLCSGESPSIEELRQEFKEVVTTWRGWR